MAIPDSKQEYTARVVGTDPPTDVAVLKIDATGLPAITLGDSDQLEVGDVVLAIGNPFGVGQSVTMGIVSALGRNGGNIGMDDQGYTIQDFIQTDAAINPGNSGGALVDAEGRLIGINTMIKSSSEGNEGIGFAVPINLARSVTDRLISGGTVTRGWLGISLESLSPGLAESFNLPDQNGALVSDTLPGGPAQKAGIESGDVIVEFNGKKVTEFGRSEIVGFRKRAWNGGCGEGDSRWSGKDSHGQAGPIAGRCCAKPCQQPPPRQPQPAEHVRFFHHRCP